IKLAAKVFLKGQALYFIKKEVSKTLVEKSLGSFTMDTDKSPIFEFNKTAKDISSKAEMDALNKTMLPKAFHKLDAAEIMNVLDQAKGDDGKINTDMVTAFAKSFEVAENAKAEEIFNKLQKMSLVNHNLIKWDNLKKLKAKTSEEKTFGHNLNTLKTSVFTKEAFITSYANLIAAAKNVRPDDPEAIVIIRKHEALHVFYEKINELKGKVHSRKLTDTIRLGTTRLANGQTVKDRIAEARVVGGGGAIEDIYNEVVALEELFLAKLQPEETPPAAEGPEQEEQSAAPVLGGAE
ncbi:MAG: hypothetical protein RI909_1431, partial [Bacteroidota bacterium]